MKENTSLQMTESSPKIKKFRHLLRGCLTSEIKHFFHSAYPFTDVFSLFAELWHHFVAASTPKMLQRPREHGPDLGLAGSAREKLITGLGTKLHFPIRGERQNKIICGILPVVKVAAGISTQNWLILRGLFVCKYGWERGGKLAYSTFLDFTHPEIPGSCLNKSLVCRIC